MQRVANSKYPPAKLVKSPLFIQKYNEGNLFLSAIFSGIDPIKNRVFQVEIRQWLKTMHQFVYFSPLESGQECSSETSEHDATNEWVGHHHDVQKCS